MQLTSLTILFFASSVWVARAADDFGVMEYEWARPAGDYIDVGIDATQYLSGRFVAEADYVRFCRKARTQLRATDPNRKIRAPSSFGLFEIKLVPAKKAASLNLLLCPTHTDPIYMKRISDENFVLYKKGSSAAGPSNAGGC